MQTLNDEQLRMNTVLLCGRLTRDPVLKFLPSGKAVCNFGIAINRKWKAVDGSKNDEVCFVNIVVWDKVAESCAKYLTKGREIILEGLLQSREWKDAEGAKREIVEVVGNMVQFMGSKNASDIE